MKNSVCIFWLLMLPIFSFAQQSGVVPLGNNFLYRGIENPIKVLADGYACDSLIVTSNMRFHWVNRCTYSVVPMNQHIGTIKLNVRKEGDTVIVGRHDFRLLTTPDPIAYVYGSRDGRITYNALRRVRRLEARLDDFMFDVKFSVKSFSVILEMRDSIVYNEDIKGEMFTTDLRLNLLELTPYKVIFENIMVVDPAGLEREIASLDLNIR